MKHFIVLLLLLCAASPFVLGTNRMTDWVSFQVQLFRQSTTTGFHLFLRFPARMKMEAIWDTCAYNAWVPYQRQAIPSIDLIGCPHRLRGSSQDIETAISYAIYRCMKYELRLMPVALQNSVDTFFASLGYDASITAAHWNSPARVGNLIADLVIQHYNAIDFVNSNGTDSSSRQPGVIYSDNTGYTPVNPPMPEIGKSGCVEVVDINHWQPPLLPVPNPYGAAVQPWLDVQFARFKPFGGQSAADFRSAPPPFAGTPSENQFYGAFLHIADVFSHLGDQEKALAEFWQSRGWWRSDLALKIALQRNLTLEQSIKYFFLVAHATMDATAAQHESKHFYNFARPTTVIQCRLRGTTIKSWRGPYLGVGDMDGGDWKAYRPIVLIQNHGSEYPCGHCTGTGAFVEASRRFFGGSEDLGYTETWAEGSFPLEPKITDPNDPRFINGVTNVPNQGPESVGYAPVQPITLHFATWTQLDQSVIPSRINLGVHTQMAGEAGLELGHKVGHVAWEKAQSLWIPRNPR